MRKFYQQLKAWIRLSRINLWWDGFDEGEKQGWRMGFRAGQDSLLPDHNGNPYSYEGSDDDLPVKQEIGGL